MWCGGVYKLVLGSAGVLVEQVQVMVQVATSADIFPSYCQKCQVAAQVIKYLHFHHLAQHSSLRAQGESSRWEGEKEGGGLRKDAGDGEEEGWRMIGEFGAN